jgi:hypothetical protein
VLQSAELLLPAALCTIQEMQESCWLSQTHWCYRFCRQMRQQNTLDAFIKKPARPPRPKMKRMYTSTGKLYESKQTC